MFYPALAVISCHCTKDCCGCHAMVHNVPHAKTIMPLSYYNVPHNAS